MTWIGWLLKRLLMAYLLWGGLLFLLQRRILFPKQMTPSLEQPGLGVRGLEQLWRPTPVGPVEAWFLPGHGVSEAQPGPAVLFAHGNAELIEYCADEMNAYRRMGISVLLPEFRGYGRSAGQPSESAIVMDFTGFYDDLVRRPEVDASRIVFHGRSLGGGVVCSLAARREPAALILQSTFTSVRSFAHGYLLPGFLIRDPFDNLDHLKALRCPIFIAHGTRDSMIPFSHGQKLYAAAQARQQNDSPNAAPPFSILLAYDSDHNDFPANSPAYFQEIEEFLRKADILPRHGPRAKGSPTPKPHF